MRVYADFRTGAEHHNSADGAFSPAHEKIVISAPRAVIGLASGRGGTGKSALAVNLAAAMAMAGRKVGLLDADLNGPSIPGMLGIRPFRMMPMVGGIEPAGGPLGLRVMAANLMPDGDEPPAFSFAGDEPEPAPVREPGPLEVDYSATLATLAGQTRFGTVDLVIVDLAPGLDHLYRAIRMIEMSGVILVGHPSGWSTRLSRAAAELIGNGAPPIAGLIENMVGFNCDSCHSVRPLFPVAELAGGPSEHPLLARLPFDPRLAVCSGHGTLFVKEYADTPLARQITELARQVEQIALAQQPREPLSASRF
ncbi:MAG TPA: P-loop NTPase [Candidatus Binataceae bacterium]|nr:P-loop NTPase [Candidatus Binataceae bacterium]